MKSLLYVSVLLIFGACTHESGHARGELEVQEIEETATIPQIVLVDRIEEVAAQVEALEAQKTRAPRKKPTAE